MEFEVVPQENPLSIGYRRPRLKLGAKAAMLYGGFPSADVIARECCLVGGV